VLNALADDAGGLLMPRDQLDADPKENRRASFPVKRDG
jgi:hypothetical protein